MILGQARASLGRLQTSTIFTAPSQAAHKKIIRLYDYWRNAAPGAGVLPGRKHVDPIGIPLLLSNIWLLDVVGEPRRFRFRLLGGDAQRKGSPGRIGEFIDQFFAKDHEDEALEDLHFVAAEGQPVWFRGKPRLKHTAEISELERIHLPLAADGANVDMILSLTVFYAFDGREV